MAKSFSAGALLTRLSLLAALFHFGLTGSLWAQELEKKTYQEILPVIEAALKENSASEVLVAFDLDNTLLKTDQDLGGEQWFEWQTALLQNPSANTDPDAQKQKSAAIRNKRNIKGRPPMESVASNFSDLLVKQSLILGASRMSLTDSFAPKLVEQLQAKKIHTMIITSRGLGEVGYTQRELRRNGYDFSKTALPAHGDFAGFYTPVDPADPSRAGLTAQEIKDFNLATPRPVGYLYGVLYVEGQHKGGILRTLLKKTHTKFKTVIYIDNLTKHLKGMHDAVTSAGMELITIHYTGMVEELARFNSPASHTKTLQDFHRFWNTLHEVFGYPAN